MLTPMDIHNHQFKKSIRGYNENEVDDFLDRIVVDFEKLLRENERLRNLVSVNENDLEKYRKLEKTMNDALLVAQKTADDVISAARKNADEMKENTARECQNIREQARLEAQQQIEAANVKRDAILGEYSKIISEKNSFLLKIRTALESELAITNQNLNAITQIEIAAKKSQPEEQIQLPESIALAEGEEKISAPLDEPESNLGDTQVVEKKNAVTEATKIYTFAKKTPAPDEEAAK